MVATQASTLPIMRPQPGRIMAQAHITHHHGQQPAHIIRQSRIVHLSRITSTVTHLLNITPIAMTHIVVAQGLALSLDTASYVVPAGQLEQTWVTAFGTKPLGSVVTVMLMTMDTSNMQSQVTLDGC